MSHDDKILNRVKTTQKTVFRKAKEILPLKAISIDSGLGYTTVMSHAKGDAGMSLACLNYYLEGGFSPELLSLLLPDSFLIVKVPDGVDHDEISKDFHDYLRTKTDAHHPDSPDGPAISDCERKQLDSKIAQIRERAA